MIKSIIKKILAIIIRVKPTEVLLEGGSGEIKDSILAIIKYVEGNKKLEQYNFYVLVSDLKRYKEKYKKYPNIKPIKTYNTKRKSISEIYHGLRAGFCLYTHYCPGLSASNKQKNIFITHAAVPLKNSKGASKVFTETDRHDVIVSTSKFAAELRCRTFNGGLDKIIITGLPRNDELFNADKETKAYRDSLNCEKLIVWLPTFKHFSLSNRVDFAEESNSDISLLTDSNMEIINKILKKNNAKLIIKFHPSQDLRYIEKINKSNIITFSDKEFQKHNISLYSLLGLSDAIITDYSSVYIDYLLINKPICFEVADMDNYASGRGFNVENPYELMPGAKIKNINDFEKEISNILSGNDKYKKERMALLDKVHTYKDDKSTERLLKGVGLL